MKVSVSPLPTAARGQSRTPIVDRTAAIQTAVIGLLLMLVFWGQIREHLIGTWLADGNWSHGWLIPVFSVYFLMSRRERLADCAVRPSYTGAVILALSLAMYFISGWVFRYTYPQSVALVGSIFGIVLLMAGWQVMRVAWFPILFLLLAIPLPPQIYSSLTMPLQAFAATVAATVMPWFAPGLYTEAQAVVIDYIMPNAPPGQLNVEEACSGMRLLMAFVTLGVAMAYVRERPTWQRVMIVLACVPIAVFCNSIRVTITGLLHIYGLHEFAKGTPHQLLGIAMLLLAMGMYALTGYVVGHLFIEEELQDGAPAGSGLKT